MWCSWEHDARRTLGNQYVVLFEFSALSAAFNQCAREGAVVPTAQKVVEKLVFRPMETTNVTLMPFSSDYKPCTNAVDSDVS